MYVLPQIWELEMLGVYFPGVPNEERIYLKAHLDANLADYFLMTGWQLTEGTAIPLNDVLWLGLANLTAAGGSWIVVYTGPGERKVTRMTTGEPAIVLHWGRPFTMFGQPQVVPMLIRIDSVAVGRQVKAGQERSST